jgi:hypothetical protein
MVGELPRLLQLRDIEASLRQILDGVEIKFVLLMDRLDEGYEPDAIGVGMIDGLVQAALDVKGKLGAIRPILFLRDNVYRAVARQDPDYSRTIEGQELRLYWDEYNLLNLTANRLRAAFKVEQEQNIKVWDRYADAGLEGKEGFRKCLRLTLYRPRDLLILLNNAFLKAAQQERNRIVVSDLDSSAKSISMNRLDDLKKEYSEIIPGLPLIVDAFANASPEMAFDAAVELLKPIFSDEELPPEIRQYFAIANSPESCLRDLYSVGFLGIKDKSTGNFIFCHDGRDRDSEISANQTILIHPCYWMALNIFDREIQPEMAQEIYDEYDIKVSSETPERRSSEIGGLIAEEGNIPHGKEGWVDFENWTLRALKIVFAGHLTNIQLKPNGAVLQRRDIVARNIGTVDIWRHIRDKYQTTQVIFEVKNYKDLGADEFRQALSYAVDPYGKCIFIVTRADNDNLTQGTELDWVRSMYHEHDKRLVVKLSSKVICSQLAKLRNPQKHNAPEKFLTGLIDNYERRYLSLPKSR